MIPLPSTASSGFPAAGSCTKFPLPDAIPQGRAAAAARSWGRGSALQVATAPPAPPVGERPPGAARRGRRGGGCAPCAAPGARRGPGSQEAPRRVWPARPARPRRAPAGSRPGRGEGHGGEPGRGGPRGEGGKKKKEERRGKKKKKQLHRIRVLGRAGGSVPLPLPLPHSFLPRSFTRPLRVRSPPPRSIPCAPGPPRRLPRWPPLHQLRLFPQTRVVAAGCSRGCCDPPGLALLLPSSLAEPPTPREKKKKKEK